MNDIEDQLPEESVEADAAVEFIEGDSAAEQVEVEQAAPTPAEEIEKWRDLAARSQAELENFRKRMARERTEAIQYANRGLLEELLPILDNFEMGLKAAEDAGAGDASMILQGMGMVRKQLSDFLSDQGVEAVVADGAAFDPNLHEAIKQEPSDEIPEGQVIATVRRGYRLKDRLLRAANVIVSSGPAE